MTTWGRKLDARQPGGLDLGLWGRFVVLDRQHLGVRTSAGLQEVEVEGLLEDGKAGFIGWFDPDTGVALLAGNGSQLVRVDLARDEATTVAALQREPDEDLRFVSFHEAAESVICLFEKGVICLSRDGSVRWKAEHNDLSAQFEGYRDGAVWFASQWPPDRVGYRFAYRLSDGESIAG